MGLVLLPSCSFKKPSESKGVVQQISGLSTTDPDSDGDGITDSEEIKNGTNPLIAQVPEFKGKFFEELKLKVNFYRRSDNSSFSTTFHVKNTMVNEGGVRLEERDYISYGSEFLAEDAAKQVNKVSFFGSHLKSSIDKSYLNLFSPPRMNDKRVLPFSKNVKEILEFAEYDSIDFTLSNGLHFSDLSNNSLTDLIIDLVWYNEIEKKLVTIGSDFVKGTYQFNKTYNAVPFSFKLSNKEIAKRIVDGGARNIFIKIRDFRIVETGVFYKQIIQSVLEKSVPVVISNGESVKTVFVGLGGGNKGFQDILSMGLDTKFLVQNSRLMTIGEKTEKVEISVDAFGNSQNMTSRWFVVTNEIHNNPFTYSFSASDIIVLSYNKNMVDFNLVPSYFSLSLSDSKYTEPKTVYIQRSNFPYFRLGLKTESFEGHIQNGKSSDNCNGIGNYCWDMFSSPISSKGQSAKEASALVEVVINNKTFNLYDLYQKALIKLIPRNEEISDVYFDPSILEDVRSGTNLTITVQKAKSNSRSYCTGKVFCTSSYFECSQLNPLNNQCLGSGEFDRYIINDQTTKTNQTFKASLLMSIEYL